MEYKDKLGGLKAQAQNIAGEHKKQQARNGLFYGSTNLIAIVALIAAILIPVDKPWYGIAIKAALGLVAAMFFLDRFYDFRARVRYHCEMRNSYLNVWARTEHYLNLPVGFNEAEIRKVYDALFAEYLALTRQEWNAPTSEQDKTPGGRTAKTTSAPEGVLPTQPGTAPTPQEPKTPAQEKVNAPDDQTAKPIQTPEEVPPAQPGS